MNALTSRFPMVILLALLTAALLISGCSSVKKENNEKTIVELVEHIKKTGLTIDSAQPTLYDMILASDGLVLKIDGGDIQLFKYDTKIRQQKDKLARIKDKNTIMILGVEFPAMVNGSFVMLNYKGHIDELKIIDAFESF